jgi:hypothetical protein
VTRLIRTSSEPATVSRNGTRISRSAANAEERLPIFLESLPPSYQARLSLKARQAIQRECRRMWLHCGDEEMHETGGWLLADRRIPDHILYATEPGVDALHARSSMRLGSERLEAVEAQIPHWVASGSWHVHPGPDEDGVPSSADREAWANWRELDGVGYHIGVIVTRGRAGGWSAPEYHGWLTTESFCERLRLT